jgi:hypothetical protein
MDTQKAVFSQFHQQQQKYIYYLITISAAGIGFAIEKSFGQPFKMSMVLLGCALLFWALSIYLGLKRLKYGMSNLFANIELLKIEQGQHWISKVNPDLIQAAREGVKEGMDANSQKASSFFKLQGTFFILGVISFILWHGVEIYLATIS